MPEPTPKKRTIWSRLFGKAPSAEKLQQATLASPSEQDVGIGDLSDFIHLAGDQDLLLKELPIDRIMRYRIFDEMMEDPLIYGALRLHISQAIGFNEEKGASLFVESKTDQDDPIVAELRELSHKLKINEKVYQWGMELAKYGLWGLRIYGNEKRGVTNLRSDVFTHPSSFKIFEQQNRLVGFLSRYQTIFQQEMPLIEPWKMIAFKLSGSNFRSQMIPPMTPQPMDLYAELNQEYVIESQDYGTSILEGAYKPWVDFMEANLSLLMSRRNASKRDRVIGYPMGGMSPVKAAQLTNMIADRLKIRKKNEAQKKLQKGYVATIDDFLLPYQADGKGRLEFSVVDPSPNIDGIEDLMLHVKRLCGALGIDPSLLGFGDMLSGGLGEGGWFRLSIVSALFGEQIRKSLIDGLNRLFEIHIAYKYKKIYPQEQQPWRIHFQSLASAKEHEGRTTTLLRMELVERVNQWLLQLPEAVDRDAYLNFMLTDILQMDETKWKDILKKPPPQEEEQPEPEEQSEGETYE